MQELECDDPGFDWVLASNFKHRQCSDCSCFEFIHLDHKHVSDYILDNQTHRTDYRNCYWKLLRTCSHSSQ